MVSNYGRLRVLVLTLCVVLAVRMGAGATPPSCGCDELDPLSQAYQDCTSSCTGSEVPVSGGAWVLVAAGLVLAIASTKLYKQDNNRQ